jgi:arginase
VAKVELTRRDAALGGALAAAAASAYAAAPAKTPIRLILAPSNLGLRPSESGAQQGAWRAPAALMEAGLRTDPGMAEVVALDRPAYEFGAQQGTRIRNGQTIRRFSLALGEAVRSAIEDNRFPLVIGGDCSVLLGALYGMRRARGRGLVHIDGHSDFFHPGNYDANARLGSVAGMDLALATGRGEALLTEWPGIGRPLVLDEDAIQVGERDALSADYDKYYGDIVRTQITRLIIQDVLRMGIEAAAAAIIDRLSARDVSRAWLHVDLDVLDQSVMPAVDSPGSPGFDFTQLAALLGALLASGRIVGATVAIYDPERDPDRRYARPIVGMLREALRELPSRS